MHVFWLFYFLIKWLSFYFSWHLWNPRCVLIVTHFPNKMPFDRNNWFSFCFLLFIYFWIMLVRSGRHRHCDLNHIEWMFYLWVNKTQIKCIPNTRWIEQEAKRASGWRGKMKRIGAKIFVYTNVYVKLKLSVIFLWKFAPILIEFQLNLNK